MPDGADRPLGRDAVRAALIDATTELILEKGVTMSVREIAQRAHVNHGLVHTYFGSKEGLLTAAFDAINARAAAELDDAGFPPADLAFRRNGEVARAIARVMLDVADDPFPFHPILPSWRKALTATRPGASGDELDEDIVIATTLALGWALFADHLCDILEIGPERQAAIQQRVLAMGAEIGGLPTNDAGASPGDSPGNSTGRSDQPAD